MTVAVPPEGRGDVLIYKMRDLNQRTAEVIQEVNDWQACNNHSSRQVRRPHFSSAQ